MSLQKVFWCRLCLRIQPQKQVREIQVEVELHLKILESVDVDIQAQDHTTVVCTNCLRLVDIVYRFRTACQRANAILTNSVLQIMPKGSWESEDTCQVLLNCQHVVKSHCNEMEVLHNRCGFEKSNNFEMEYDVTSEEEYEKEDQEYEREQVRSEESQEVHEDDAGEHEVDQEEYEVDQLPMIIKDESISLPGMAVQSRDDSADDENYFENIPTFCEDLEFEPRQLKSTHYFCEECGKVVPNTKIEHHKNFHLGVKPYLCPQQGCGISFYSLKTCRAHEKQVHKTALLKCEVCDKLLKGIHAFRRHMNGHGENNPRKISCPICNKLFYKSYLKDHQSVHTGEMLHECPDCGSRYGAKANLLTHRKRCRFSVENAHAVVKTRSKRSSK
ncbi:zinc finger protein 528-like [Sabethes cyaneus]|uniref:zinc finger protein 528-like n=1 Tax=Sabethes cyaneus TaxID=53552 RepID=UPI00237D4F12|nr:zinc finger protein 528-like [Sabethes cyaneus]